MTQINSFNGGTTLPGSTLKKADLKNLVLMHFKPSSSTPSTETYAPLTGKTISIANLVISKNGTKLGEYDPLNGTTSIDIPSDANLFNADVSGSGKITDEEYQQILSTIADNTAVSMVSATGSSATIWTLVRNSATGLKFATATTDNLSTIDISSTNDGGYHTITLTTKSLADASVGFIYTGSGGSDIGSEYTKCTQIWSNSNHTKIPVIVYQNGSSVTLVGTLSGVDGGGYSFLAYYNSQVYNIRVISDGNVVLSQITPDIPDTYIKKASCTTTGWLQWWASERGMAFGDILGAVCDSGNNKHYDGQIAVNGITSCSCVPCGLILFLDETGSNALATDECRNVSIDLNLFMYTNAEYDSESSALAAIPSALWLRVFTYRPSSSTSNGHAPLNPSAAYDSGNFVSQDTVHLHTSASLNATANKYYAEATVRIQVSVIDGQWTFAYKN